MTMNEFTALAGFGLIATVFLLVLAILWALVPFLIMGTNKRLSRLIDQNEELLARGSLTIAGPKPGTMDYLYNRNADPPVGVLEKTLGRFVK